MNVGATVGENEIDLLSSLTGFMATDSLATFQPTTGGGVAVTTFSTNLSAITALQNVTAPVEFRLYMSGIESESVIRLRQTQRPTCNSKARCRQRLLFLSLLLLPCWHSAALRYCSVENEWATIWQIRSHTIRPLIHEHQ